MLTLAQLGPIALWTRCLVPGACGPNSALPPPTLTRVADDVEIGTLRGDWEAPDTLLVVFNDDWPETLAAVTREGVRNADVWMMIEDGHTRAEARTFLRRMKLPAELRSRIKLLRIVTDSAWVRDYGPLQVQQPTGNLMWLDGDYAGERRRDDAVPAALAALQGMPLETLGFPLDGGAIASSGTGLCVTTSDYLLGEGVDPNDEATLQPLAAKLGCRGLLSVPALEREATRHVDPFVQFLTPTRVAVSSVDKVLAPADHRRTELAVRAIRAASKRLGLAMDVVRVPMWIDEATYYTYVNGLQLADSFLAPSYRAVPVEVEAAAFEELATAMPHRVIIPVPADELIDAEGVIHCMTLGLGRDPDLDLSDAELALARVPDPDAARTDLHQRHRSSPGGHENRTWK